MILKDIRDYSGIYLAVKLVDFKKAVDGLAHIVKQELKMDHFGNYLFLFYNYRRNKLKCLTLFRHQNNSNYPDDLLIPTNAINRLITSVTY